MEWNLSLEARFEILKIYYLSQWNLLVLVNVKYLKKDRAQHNST